VVGRGSEADLRIDDPGVSRRHAELRVQRAAGGNAGPGVSVVDLGSTNGMLVDGRRVDQATLQDGSTVKIGNTTMTVRFLHHAGDGPAEDRDRHGGDHSDDEDGWGGPSGWGGSGV
jgi:pSer/pThr/pTyr-binding forkhead associated (FHA) protein